MMFLPILGRLLPYLGAALLAWGLWYKADHWENSAYREAAAERDEARAAIKIAQDRATALALLWAKQLEVTDEQVRKARSERSAAFAGIAARARSLSDKPIARLSPTAARVLDDASRRANEASTPPSGSEAAPDPVPPAPDQEGFLSERELAEKWAQAAEAYADAYGQWLGCVKHYEALREQ